MKNILDYGAIGDGKTVNTTAIQRALDDGGLVTVPAGIFVTGTLYLRSHGGLDIQAGAVLKASPNPTDYNADDFCPQNQIFAGEMASGAHLIVAVEQEDITLQGGGVIDGNARFWLNELDMVGGRIGYKYPPWRMGQLIFFCESREIAVHGLRLFDASHWSLFFHGCQEVRVQNLHIDADMAGHNGDGIDVDCCQNVMISGCNIQGSDDCITIRAYGTALKQPRPCEHVTVSNCILRTHEVGIRLGVGDGLVRRVLCSDIIIRGASVGVNVCSRWRNTTSGVTVEDASFHDFYIDCERPYNITNVVSYIPGDSDSLPGALSRLDFRHWRGRASRTAVLHEIGGGIIRDVRIEDFDLEFHGDNDHATPEGSRWCHDGGIINTDPFWNCGGDNIRMDDIRVRWGEDATNWNRETEGRQIPWICHRYASKR